MYTSVLVCNVAGIKRHFHQGELRWDVLGQECWQLERHTCRGGGHLHLHVPINFGHYSHDQQCQKAFEVKLHNVVIQ